MYINRIKQVQKYLIDNNIDGYLAFLSDDHGSEYITSRFKVISFLSAFTGSAGTLLITKDSSYLWTDGRYFLQASIQLLKSNTKLMKIGEDTPLIDYINNNLSSLAFDFTLATGSFVSKLKTKIINERKLIDNIWTNRPSLSKSKLFIIPDNKCHMNAFRKCHNTLKHHKTNNKYGVLISALDDIAYLLNLRGKDIPCNPVFMSYLFLSKENDKEQYTLYIDSSKLNKEIKEKLEQEKIMVKPYNKIYKDVEKFDGIIYCDYSKTNYALYDLMKKPRNRVLWPTINKSIKRKVEINESKEAHLKDAIAMCKFLYYIKTNVGKKQMDELSVSTYLKKLRKKQGAYDLSFNTICGYKEHGAIIHYSATKESNKQIENDGFLLVDSGGQYYYGTTDITRTIALNNITDKMKYHFTLVLKAHIALSSAVFDKHTTDASLDHITRKPLWDNNLDYNHGTGHGVGHILNVHEGPQSIRYNKVNPIFMKKGMITSNEPGLYFENEYGIRHENEILCVELENNKLGFEPITYVPFDLDGIDVSMLDEKERKWLNDYHKMVYDKVNKYLNNKERKFLAIATKEI